MKGKWKLDRDDPEMIELASKGTTIVVGELLEGYHARSTPFKIHAAVRATNLALGF